MTRRTPWYVQRRAKGRRFAGPVGWLVALLLITAPAAVVQGSGPDDPADAPSLAFSKLCVDDGLSNNAVMTLLQDHLGFLWIGTQEGGLNRYDGYTFTVYKNDARQPESLSHNFVWTLFEDSNNDLWIGTLGGLDRYDPATDSFVHFRPDPDDPTSLPGLAVRAIYEDSAGRLWVGGSGGLSRMDRETGTFITMGTDTASGAGGNVQSIVEDRATGLLWLASSDRGVSVFDPESETFHHYRHDPDDPTSISSDDIFDIFQDSDGALWFSSPQAGLNRFDRATETFIRYQRDPADRASLGNNAVWDSYEDSRGRFWVATSGGLYQMDRATETFEPYRADPNDPRSVSSNRINGVTEDEAGNLWLLTGDSGLNMLPAPPPRFTVYRHTPGSGTSLTPGGITALFVPDDETIWVGTSQGLNRLDLESGSSTRYQHDPDDPTSLPTDQVRSLTGAPDGGLWVGTARGGLSYFDGQTFTTYRADPDNADSIAADVVLGLAVEPDGLLWLTVFGAGMDRFDGETFTHFAPDGDTALPPAYLSTMIADRTANLLWIATEEDGLLRFDRTTETFTLFRPSGGDPARAGLDRLTMIHQDEDGALWLATFGGLLRFDPAAGSFTDLYTVGDGLADNVVMGIVQDDAGHLWLTTSDGLSRFDPAAGTFRNYDSSDGVLGDSFARAAIVRTPDGRLFVGSSQGLSAFYPQNMQDNPYVPPVVLTGFELFNEPVLAGHPGSPLDAPLNQVDKITLAHDEAVLSFTFAALNFIAPENNQYAYMLEGFDDGWRYTSADRRVATYTNLDPGRYVFRVRASNNDGLWNEAGRSLTIIVTPPWWQTWWAYLLYGIGAVMGVAGLIAWRTRRISRRNQALEAQLAERQRNQAERERLLGQVQAQSEQTQSIMDTVPEGIVLLDRDYRIVSANPTAERLLPLVAGVKVGTVMTRMGEQSVVDLVTSPPEGLWHEVKVLDGNATRYFAVIARSIDSGPFLQNWVLVFREITVERTIQEKAAQQQRLASIGQFAAGIAHDFNNILSVILLDAEMLLRYADLDERFRAKAVQISEQSQGASRLIQQILDYSRQMVMERHPMDLAASYAKQVDLIGDILPESITLTYTHDDRPYMIDGDPTRLGQVLMNLVVNARDAMPQGGEIEICLDEKTITTQTQPIPPVGTWVTLTVRDTGIGIPEDLLPRIYEPFVTTKPVGEGTGLGLAQIFGIVKQHDGYIDVQSTVGQGTTFFVYLPVYGVERSAIVMDPGEPRRDLVMGQGQTILVVEDKAALRESLVESLRQINYTVLSATDGEDALRQWDGQAVDLVLSDVVMPRMSGISLVYALVERGAVQPIILMTGHLLGHHDDQSLAALRREHMVELLAKPVDLRLLSSVIARVLRQAAG